jgi:hypothetical protein
VGLFGMMLLTIPARSLRAVAAVAEGRGESPAAAPLVARGDRAV